MFMGLLVKGDPLPEDFIGIWKNINYQDGVLEKTTLAIEESNYLLIMHSKDAQGELKFETSGTWELIDQKFLDLHPKIIKHLGKETEKENLTIRRRIITSSSKPLLKFYTTDIENKVRRLWKKTIKP